MTFNQVPTCAAPKSGRTKALVVGTLLPVLAGTAVAVSSPAHAATSDQQAAPKQAAANTTTPSTRSATKTVSAKKLRAQKVKRTKVFVVGDSLTVGSSSSIRSNLKRKTRSVQVNAQVGRFTPAGVSILRSGKAKRAHVWVVALGTNDGPNTAATKRYVRKVMKMAGKRQVIWLTLVRPGKYTRVNTALKQMDRKYAKLTVADWARVVKQNKRLLAGDRVHLTHHGYKVRGKYIAKTVINVAGR